jgi:uncharacterized protein YndB with AHSA1/START domain
VLDSLLLNAIASARRREILRLLSAGERSAGAIHEAMPDVTFGAVSLQLKVRLNAGLVDRIFCETPRWAEWWGAGTTIDATPGGQMRIRHPNGAEVTGEVLEVSAPERIVFTYGFVSGKPIPAGSSRVSIRLDAHPQGTLLQLTHEFADQPARDEHVQGWRFQLSLSRTPWRNTPPPTRRRRSIAGSPRGATPTPPLAKQRSRRSPRPTSIFRTASVV